VIKSTLARDLKLKATEVVTDWDLSLCCVVNELGCSGRTNSPKLSHRGDGAVVPIDPLLVLSDGRSIPASRRLVRHQREVVIDENYHKNEEKTTSEEKLACMLAYSCRLPSRLEQIMTCDWY